MCMHVCMRVYVSIPHTCALCVCMCMCMHVCMRVYVSIPHTCALCVCMCMCMHVCMCVCVYMYLSLIHVHYVCVCVCVCMCVCVYMYLSLIHVHYVCVCVCVCMCVCVYMYLSLVHVHYVCVCVCVCMCACVYMYLSLIHVHYTSFHCMAIKSVILHCVFFSLLYVCICNSVFYLVWVIPLKLLMECIVWAGKNRWKSLADQIILSVLAVYILRCCALTWVLIGTFKKRMRLLLTWVKINIKLLNKIVPIYSSVHTAAEKNNVKRNYLIFLMCVQSMHRKHLLIFYIYLFFYFLF